MKRYMAARGESGTYLSRTEQIAEFRERGCDIYEVDGDKRRKLDDREIMSAASLKSEKSMGGGVRDGE